MTEHPRPVARRIPFVVLFVPFAVLGLLLTNPSVNAEVNRLVQRFGFVVVDKYPDVHVTTANPLSKDQAWTTFEKVQQTVQFKVRLPQWLPEGLALEKIGAFPNEPDPLGNPAKPYQVVAAFQMGNAPQPTAPALTLDMRPVSMGGGFLIDASKVENVSVNGVGAVFAKGTWNAQHEWQDNAKSAYLSWQEDGVQYAMNAVNLTKEEMLRIAESIAAPVN
jgi:hypothetical protein